MFFFLDKLFQAFAWGFDVCSWQRHLNPLTWPEILRQFALAAGYGPKLTKRNVDQASPHEDNEVFFSTNSLSIKFVSFDPFLKKW